MLLKFPREARLSGTRAMNDIPGSGMHSATSEPEFRLVQLFPGSVLQSQHQHTARCSSSHKSAAVGQP